MFITMEYSIVVVGANFRFYAVQEGSHQLETVERNPYTCRMIFTGNSPCIHDNKPRKVYLVCGFIGAEVTSVPAGSKEGIDAGVTKN